MNTLDISSPSTEPSNGRVIPGAWKSLALLVSINLFNYIDRFILAAVNKPISEEFGVSKTQMGWLATAFLLSYMFFSPVFGWLADHARRWLLVGVGVILWSLASGGSGLAMGFIVLLIMRGLIGVGEAAYGPVAPTIIADLYPIERRGSVLAWFYCAIPVGGALGYLIGGLFVKHWHWAFYATVPPGLLLGVLCFLMREPVRGASEKHVIKHKATFRDYTDLFKIPSYTINTAGMTLMTFAIGGISYWMPRYLQDERGIDESKSNIYFGGIIVVAGLLATLVGGWTGDKLRSKYSGSYFIVSALGMIVGTPLFIAVLYVDFPSAWGVLFCSVFCLFFNTGPANTILANVTPASTRATAFALNILIIHALGDAISPILIGWIGDQYSLKAGFFLVSILMLVGGIIWLFGAKHLQADTRRVLEE